MTSDENSPPIVPKKYAGKWIAWNADRSKILGSGRTLAEVKQTITTKDDQEAVFAKAPQDSIRFVGTA